MFSASFKLTLSLVLVSATLAVACQDAKTDFVSVSAEGRRSVKTSIAMVTLGIEQQGANAQIVQSQLARKSTQLVAYLRQQRVAKLSTRGISLLPTFDFKVSPPRTTGFRGSNTISFEVAIRRSGGILDGSVRNGATRINGVSFKASARANAFARKMALKDAVKNARMEAVTVALASGNKLGRAIEIRITNTFFPNPISSRQVFARARGSLAADVSTPVIGGEQTVSARVSITYDIY